MKSIVQFHIYKSDTHYVAEGTDLPVVTQGKTLDELIANLKEAVELHLENEDVSMYDLVPHPALLANIEIGPLIYAKT